MLVVIIRFGCVVLSVLSLLLCSVVVRLGCVSVYVLVEL